MKPQLKLTVDELVKAGKLQLSKEDRRRLVKISPTTIDRLMKKYKKRLLLKGRSYTKPGTLLKNQIPIRTFNEWSENKVGFFEVDLVGHDGSKVLGDFAWTLDFVDVKSAWTEQVAVFNKAQVHVFAGIQRIRGRPGKENDNPYVEQKNDSIVRNWVGYGRFNTQSQVDILNEFYELLRLYTNFFLPVMRFKKKTRVGSKIKKIYDKPTTPYRRILRARDVSKEVKDKLRNQYKTLSLVKLKEQIDEVLKRLKPTQLQ